MGISATGGFAEPPSIGFPTGSRDIVKDAFRESPQLNARDPEEIRASLKEPVPVERTSIEGLPEAYSKEWEMLFGRALGLIAAKKKKEFG